MKLVALPGFEMEGSQKLLSSADSPYYIICMVYFIKGPHKP